MNQEKKDAFAEIYRTYLDRIYRFVYFLVHDEALAEDITQNTFLKAWDKTKDFDEKRGTMQAYLYAIARNLVIDNQRKKKTMLLSVEVEGIIPSDENLEEQLVQKEEETELKKVLKILPEDDREIVVLKYFEDMDYKEISKVVNKKEGAIRVKLFRALKVIKEYLEKGSK